MEDTPKSIGCGVPESLLGSKPLASSPCLPHRCFFSPQGLTGPIGPPGPAGANGEKVSTGFLSPIEPLFHILPKTVISSPHSSIATLLLTRGCEEQSLAVCPGEGTEGLGGKGLSAVPCGGGRCGLKQWEARLWVGGTQSPYPWSGLPGCTLLSNAPTLTSNPLPTLGRSWPSWSRWNSWC